MKTILIFVSTIDGKITKWGDPRVSFWSSHQDQDYYKKVRDESGLIVMGSNTFKAESPEPATKQHLIIMTGNPDKYKSFAKPGLVEFTKESPGEITGRFKEKGVDQMLVVGGPHVATSFLKEQLIDEIWLTIEPRIFGSGGNFVIDEKLDIQLHLNRSDRVNEEGTLINRYAVIKK